MRRRRGGEQHFERERDCSAVEAKQQGEVLAAIERALELTEVVGLERTELSVAIDEAEIDLPRQLIRAAAVRDLSREQEPSRLRRRFNMEVNRQRLGCEEQMPRIAGALVLLPSSTMNVIVRDVVGLSLLFAYVTERSAVW